jgi:hypothetical protein
MRQLGSTRSKLRPSSQAIRSSPNEESCEFLSVTTRISPTNCHVSAVSLFQLCDIPYDTDWNFCGKHCAYWPYRRSDTCGSVATNSFHFSANISYSSIIQVFLQPTAQLVLFLLHDSVENHTHLQGARNVQKIVKTSHHTEAVRHLFQRGDSGSVPGDGGKKWRWSRDFFCEFLRFVTANFHSTATATALSGRTLPHSRLLIWGFNLSWTATG